MSRIIYGYDCEEGSVSTPVSVCRGSTTVLRRQCKVLDHDSQRESPLNISAATAIRWEVFHDFDAATATILSKTLVSGIALVSLGTNGIYDITLSANDTKNLTPGAYKACVAVTLAAGFFKGKPYHFQILHAAAMAE